VNIRPLITSNLLHSYIDCISVVLDVFETKETILFLRNHKYDVEEIFVLV